MIALNETDPTAAEVPFFLIKSAGTTTVRAHIDQASVAVDLNAARSP